MFNVTNLLKNKEQYKSALELCGDGYIIISCQTTCPIVPMYPTQYVYMHSLVGLQP